MNRTHWVLTGVLLAQVALILAVKAPFSASASGVAPHLFLPMLESMTPARLEIEDGEGKSVDLLHSSQGWTLEEKDNYPVDDSKVTKLLNDLKALKVRRPVVTSSRYHEALKVTADAHERRLKMWEEGSDDPKVDLFLGTSPNYRISHVRLDGDQEVYEAMGISTYDLRPDSSAWIEKKFLDIPFDKVIGIRVQNGKGSFSLEKQNGAWAITEPADSKKKSLDQAEVDSYVRSLASLWLVDPVGRIDEEAQGLARPAAKVEIIQAPAVKPKTGPEEGPGPDASPDAEASGTQTQASTPEPAGEPVVTTLLVGGEAGADSGQRYASRSGFDFAVTLSKFDSEKATQKALADLLEKTKES
ncbi:MAG: DUF4340 domain-containing protein [Acidobacteriota bacterium]